MIEQNTDTLTKHKKEKKEILLTSNDVSNLKKTKHIIPGVLQ